MDHFQVRISDRNEKKIGIGDSMLNFTIQFLNRKKSTLPPEVFYYPEK